MDFSENRLTLGIIQASLASALAEGDFEPSEPFGSARQQCAGLSRSPILPYFDDAKVERESEVFFRSKKKVSKKLFFERFFQKKGFKESLFRHFAALNGVFIYTPIHIYIYSRIHVHMTNNNESCYFCIEVFIYEYLRTKIATFLCRIFND